MPTNGNSRFVAAKAVHAAVRGHEADILDTLGIPWRQGRPHIRCPYPDHVDNNPSWRWDPKRDCAFCTCQTTKPDGIFDIVMKVRRLDFEAAKILVAELLHRDDLIKTKGRAAPQRTDPQSLLNPPADNRNDELPYRYLAARLGIAVDQIPTPSTQMVGIASLAYFDPPAQHEKNGKPVLVTHAPCAVFETIAADGRRHAHRIYLTPDGRGKAELGTDASGKPRDPKKSARLVNAQPSTAGCSVVWGNPDTEQLVVAEGIENGAVVACALREEIERGELAVLSAITANGVEAFVPWPSTRRITIAGDRDEAKPGAGFKRGERAASRLALRLTQIEVSLSLPGASGEKTDWLDVRLAEGFAAVHAGIRAAAPIVPSPENIAEFQRNQAQRNEIERIKATYPLPNGLTARLEYRARESGEIWIHKFIKAEEDEETGERNETWLPVCSPMSPTLRLHMLDDDDLYGLRVHLADMENHPRAVDFHRGELGRLAASEIRSRLLGAGLRVANGGEITIVEILKEARPEGYLDMASATGWKHDQFVSPGGDHVGTGGDLELAADVRLAPEVARGGTLMGWQAATEAAAKVKNCPHWILGLTSGFVGPILQLCELETCGIDLSGPTSCGKTLGQQLGISVWTSPRLTSGGLLKPARFTQNSIELLARQSNGTVLGLDELALVDGVILGQVIYGLAAGVGKARMSVGLKLERAIKWSTFVLLSSEQTLERKIRGDAGQWSGGMAARFADVDCADVNRKVSRARIDAISGIFRHYGQAGPTFIHRFIAAGLHRDPDQLRQRIYKMAARLADTNGARARSALPFALITVSGELARRLGVLPPVANVNAAVRWAWATFVDSQGATALDPEQVALNNLRRYIAEHRDVTIKKTRLGPFESRNNRDAVGWYDDRAVYIPVDRIADAAGGALSERAIGRMLERRKLLAGHGEDRLTVRYVPKIGHVECYALKLAEFSPTANVGSDDEIE
jgi:hypothetical protein